jgi:hypothetical protein
MPASKYDHEHLSLYCALISATETSLNIGELLLSLWTAKQVFWINDFQILKTSSYFQVRKAY